MTAFEFEPSNGAQDGSGGSRGMNLTGDRNQCQGCKAFFNSSFAFDKHRRGEHGVDRHCLTAEQMESKGMSTNSAGFWISAAMPQTMISSGASCCGRSECGGECGSYEVIL